MDEPSKPALPLNLAPPRPSGRRVAAWAGIALLLVAALEWAKATWLEAFLVARPGSLVLAFVLLLAGTLAAGFLLRAPPLGFLATLPALGIALVLLVNTPLSFELVHYAQGMPHAPGEVLADVWSGGVRRMGHPVAYALFEYPNADGLAALTSSWADAYNASGWSVVAFRAPQGDQDYGYVGATRGAFVVTCALAPNEGANATLAARCSMTVA